MAPRQIAVNTSVKVFLRLAEAERTWDHLRRLAGDEAVMETNGFGLASGRLMTGAWKDGFCANPTRRVLVHLNYLLEQTEGEAHCLLGWTFARARLFRAGPDLADAVMRVPRLLEMVLM
ncbi:MAG: hypothetical protein LBR80_06250 [Deltaproteobacteria bacterium]|jgi:intracellular multiplication protein IcmO|nr:hypothetical protein [Deltaproteobacteria bacterium]